MKLSVVWMDGAYDSRSLIVWALFVFANDPSLFVSASGLLDSSYLKNFCISILWSLETTRSLPNNSLSESIDFTFSADNDFFGYWIFANVFNLNLLMGLDSDTSHLFNLSVAKSINTFFPIDLAP